MPIRSSIARAAAALVGAVGPLLVAVPPAGADPPWSVPQTVPGAQMLRWQPLTGGGMSGFALKEVDGLFGFTPGGKGVAVLGTAEGGRGLTRLDAAGTAFGPLRASSLGGVAPSQMALYGREGMLLAGQADAKGDRRWPLNPDILLDAAVSRRTSGTRFSRRQVLAKGAAAGSPSPAVVTALAANDAGAAAAVVAIPVLGRTRVIGYRPRLFVRRRGQSSFRRVTDLGRRTFGPSPAALAVNPSGDVLVAWDDRQSVWARLVTTRGDVRRAQRLGPGGSTYAYGSRMSAAMDTTRRAIVAWIAQRVSGESASAGRPGIVGVAYAPPYKDFGRAQVVQRALPTGPRLGIRPPGVRAALLRNRGVVVWTGSTAGRFAVRAIDVVSGRPANGAVLSEPGTDAQLRGLAVGPRGGLVAAWTSATQRGVANPSPGPGVYAAARAATATAWGPVETVSAIPQGGVPAPGAPLGGDPVSGRAVLVWSEPATQNAPPAPIPVRFSVRPAPQ